jgi:hypothetical protein
MGRTGACVGAGSPGLSLADVLGAALARGVPKPRLSAHQWKVLNAIRSCRTPQLGGHRYHCEHCGRDHFVPRSCGNRHCPNCQFHQAQEWLERQEELLLPVPYFHVVFTLPHQLNALIRQNQRALYNLLFGAASQTLLQFGRNNLGAQLGVTLALHTWSRTLLDHYHVHCIVTGGGPALEGREWKSTGPKFLFPVMALSRVFQARFCEGLQKLYAEGRLRFHGQQSGLAEAGAFQALIRQATAKHWNVHVKLPFAGPEQVLRYLSRYTHRVAISQRRLIRLDTRTGTVRLIYKVRRECGRAAWEPMDLSLEEFLRRYCLHILPERFVKIRHYGLLANRGRQERLARAKALLEAAGAAALLSSPMEATQPVQAPEPETDGPASRLICPYCGERALVWVETVNGPARAPPEADFFAGRKP